MVNLLGQILRVCKNNKQSFFLIAEFSKSVEKKAHSFTHPLWSSDDKVVHVGRDLEELVLEVGGSVDAQFMESTEKDRVVVKVDLERSLLLHC